MNQPLNPEENPSSKDQPSISQQADNSAMDGMQAAIGDGNIQTQGDNNIVNVTFNKTEILQISVAEIKTRQFIQTSPYKGLKKFELEDKDLFFGRDQFLTGLVNELEQTNLILLLGASGSGKSSVVRAGLIPWLLQKEGSQLVKLILKPDREPFESFYTALCSKYNQAEAEIVREAKADTLTQVVTRLKQPDDYWFILIDQFEELFTTSQPQKRDQFIASLVKLSNTKNRSVKIMATMRADFLDRLSPYPQLVKATDKHRPLIAEMQPDELRLAIEQPAGHHGVVFETGLVEEIIKDIQGQAGYLPLLQYTLDLLWKTEVKNGSIQDRTLNISTYRQLGGVRGALQQRVDSIYGALPEPEKLATQKIFLKLVDIGKNSESGTEWKPVRRRASMSEFSNELERTVLVNLINENLLVSNRQLTSQESTVEITHETLLTSWTSLNIWIRENRNSIALRNRLNDDVAHWQARKAEDELWAGSKLEQVLELRKDSMFNQVLGGFSPAANQFIDASVGLRDRVQRRRIAVAIAFPAIIAISTLLFAIQQQKAQKTVEAVFLDTDTTEILNALPRLLQQARDYKNQVDHLGNTADIEQAIAYYQNHQSDIDKSFAYYRQILRAAGRLQQQIKKHPQEFSTSLKNGEKLPQVSQKIDGILQEAEASLAKLILKYRIPQLHKYLKKPNLHIGKVLGNTEKIDFENQYTEGALRTTYNILMRGSGAGADLNNDGFIGDTQEANQLPCEVLKEIERLWRQATEQRCGWYGSESEYSEYEDTDCNVLDINASTLTKSIFDFPAEFVVERFKYCKVPSPETSNQKIVSMSNLQ
jgi:energy-coupling factor transporter ATP-binding protein EcfA2